MNLIFRSKRTESKLHNARFVFAKSQTSKADQPPALQPSLTANLSEDEEELTVTSPKVQQISSFIFPSESTATTDQTQQLLADKQEEIVKLQAVLKELRQTLSNMEQELALTQSQLVYKTKEVTKIQQEKTHLAQDLAQSTGALAEAKKTMDKMGTELIRCQEEIYENKEKRFWQW